MILPVLFAACGEDQDEYRGERIPLPPFREVRVDHVFHIVLRQEPSFSIQVAGRQDLVEGVKYTVEDSVLILTNESDKMWLKPEHNKVMAWIYADRLKKITVNEASFVETANPIITDEFGLVTGNKYAEADLELDNSIFYFWNNFPCGGKLTLRGNTQSLRLWNYVIMSVDARQLAAVDAVVENYSKGDCFVNVDQVLYYSIHGEGSIYLYGNPQEIILLDNTGSGELIRMP